MADFHKEQINHDYTTRRTSHAIIICGIAKQANPDTLASTLLSDIYGTYALHIKYCTVPYRTVFNILICVYRTVLYRTVLLDLTIWDLDKAQLYGSVF